MIQHVVMFKFKPTVPEADREAFIASLRQLETDVEQVRALEIGRNFTASPRACDILLTVDVDDRDALQAYADHPKHQPVKKRAAELCEASYVVDYQVP